MQIHLKKNKSDFNTDTSTLIRGESIVLCGKLGLKDIEFTVVRVWPLTIHM